MISPIALLRLTGVVSLTFLTTACGILPGSGNNASDVAVMRFANNVDDMHGTCDVL
jgi:hypothetical protein